MQIHLPFCTAHHCNEGMWGGLNADCTACSHTVHGKGNPFQCSAAAFFWFAFVRRWRWGAGVGIFKDGMEVWRAPLKLVTIFQTNTRHTTECEATRQLICSKAMTLTCKTFSPVVILSHTLTSTLPQSHPEPEPEPEALAICNAYRQTLAAPAFSIPAFCQSAFWTTSQLYSPHIRNWVGLFLYHQRPPPPPPPLMNHECIKP